jgi:hypothetical protein
VGWARTLYLYVYTVYIRCFGQGNHHIYGHIRCAYTVLANPKSIAPASWHLHVDLAVLALQEQQYHFTAKLQSMLHRHYGLH